MGNISKYPIEKWSLTQELIVTRTDLTLQEIASTVDIPFDTMYAYAKRKGWLLLRDANDTRRAGLHLARIIKDIAGQTTDIHEHTVAMVEALQNSYRIMIVRDSDGHIHYQNMPPTWPTKPVNYDSLNPEEKERELLTIDQARLQNFLSDLITVLKLKMENINFLQKMIKGSLPKVEPSAVDISRRIADYTVDVLASDDSRSLEQALSDIKMLKAGD